MSDHLSKRVQLPTEMLRYINDGNHERVGEGWSFGIGHGIERTSFSSPPRVDSLARDFKKMMDELRPEPAKLGDRLLVRSQPDSNRRSLKTPAAKGQLDALDRYYSDETLES